MSSNSLKNELADHIYQYLCHEAQYSDLSEAARESLTAASECIEQAYRLNTNTTNNNNGNRQQNEPNSAGLSRPTQDTSSSILPDELLRIFTRHKEFLMQQKDPLNYPLRNENDSMSSSMDKPEIKSSLSHPIATSSNDPYNNNHHQHQQIISGNNTNNPTNASTSSTTGQSQSQPPPPHQPILTTTKQHAQHTISQLPMTTRKKLTQLRAQIKRQASKAARSRLEKRSSVSGVPSSSGSSGVGANLPRHLGGMMGTSLDVNTSSISKQGSGDGYNTNRDMAHQANISSSTESPNTYSNNQSTSSPTAHGANLGQVVGGGIGNSGGQTDSSFNSSMSPNQIQNESLASSSGTKSGETNTKLSRSHHHNHHSSLGASVHQKNFKQRLIALIKKFRTDGSGFDSEEQYREALERELMKAAAGRGSRAIEELLEEDIDVEEETGSETEDWDNVSASSTPKPSLRPFFSSTTLDKI